MYWIHYTLLVKFISFIIGKIFVGLDFRAMISSKLQLIYLGGSQKRMVSRHLGRAI